MSEKSPEKDQKGQNKNKWEKFAEDQSESDQADEILEQETEEAHVAEALEFPDRSGLEDKLTAMEQKVDDYKEKNLRVMAQMKNMQDRAERDVSNAHKYGAEKLVVDLLPVVDSLIRGLESPGEENDPIREGMKLTLDLLHKTLAKHGVEIISPEVGAPFNPEVHEAMSMQQDPNAAPNTILQCLQQGYSLNGRVLRAAMVIVAS